MSNKIDRVEQILEQKTVKSKSGVDQLLLILKVINKKGHEAIVKTRINRDLNFSGKNKKKTNDIESKKAKVKGIKVKTKKIKIKRKAKK